jgi:hypothetical protein
LKIGIKVLKFPAIEIWGLVEVNVLSERKQFGPELDAVVERLKKGDLSALELVTRENIIALLDRANDDDKIVRLLQTKL